MPTAENTFHLFSKLPTELRQAIWRECLPWRVYELDRPLAQFVYNLDEEDEAPCCLWHSTAVNRSPPVITRVCRESRAVAFETGGPRAQLAWADVPDECRWSSATTDTGPGERPWQDRVRDTTLHLNWTESYDGEYGASYDEPAPTRHLAWLATKLSCCASIMIERLDWNFSWEHCPRWMDDDFDVESPPPVLVRQPSPQQEELVHAYKQLLAGYSVVMQVVVVHANVSTASTSGLFGILGEARVQVVDMADEAKVNAFFTLAEECEHKSPVSVEQDLGRRSLDFVRRRLRDVIVDTFATEELVPLMRPAIMFRLCTLMCNHPGLAHEPAGP